MDLFGDPVGVRTFEDKALSESAELVMKAQMHLGKGQKKAAVRVLQKAMNLLIEDQGLMMGVWGEC